MLVVLWVAMVVAGAVAFRTIWGIATAWADEPEAVLRGLFAEEVEESAAPDVAWENGNCMRCGDCKGIRARPRRRPRGKEPTIPRVSGESLASLTQGGVV